MIFPPILKARHKPRTPYIRTDQDMSGNNFLYPDSGATCKDRMPGCIFDNNEGRFIWKTLTAVKYPFAKDK